MYLSNQDLARCPDWKLIEASGPAETASMPARSSTAPAESAVAAALRVSYCLEGPSAQCLRFLAGNTIPLMEIGYLDPLGC